MKESDKKKIKNDIILIIFLCIVAVVVGFVLYTSDMPDDELQLQILIDGEIVEVYSYTSDESTYKQFIMDSGNVIVLQSGEVYMESADCPDGLCIMQGKISKPGESIICLPHKLVVRLIKTSDNVHKDLDDKENMTSTNGLDVMPR